MSPSDPDMSHSNEYERGSLSLLSTVALGTGVMIGAGIFALTGQIAELAGPLFPLAFVAGAVVSGFSAYSYIRVSSVYPSAGGVAMILKKAYGPGVIAAAASLMMALSMVVSQSLVARTFSTYALRPFGLQEQAVAVPVLAVLVIAAALAINLAGSQVVGRVATATSAIKIVGIVLFGAVGIWSSGLSFRAAEHGWTDGTGVGAFVGATALAILAFKGFTTITNSGDEVVEPEKNVGRAIIISLLLSLAVYLVVAFAVGSALGVQEIIDARDYALAEAARPALGSVGVTATVILALVATSSGILASMFAVSRMLAMLTKMKLIPHSHFGMPGTMPDHTTVYVAVLAGGMAAFFDLSRIASLGVFLYLAMDMIIHVGVGWKLREEVDTRSWVVVTAFVLDAIILATFTVMRLKSDPLIVGVGVVTTLVLFGSSWWFLRDADDGGAHEVG